MTRSRREPSTQCLNARAHARAKTESELASTKSALDHERKLRVAADEEVMKQRTTWKQERADQANLLRERSVTASKAIARGVQFIAGFLLALLVYSTLPSPLVDLPTWSTDWIPPTISTGLLILYAVLSWRSLVHGTTMQSLVERGERVMAGWIERLLYKLMMLAHRDDE